MKWNDITEEKPPNFDVDLLVINTLNYQYVARFSEYGWSCCCECHEGSHPGEITHWMPLPRPPKE